MKDWRGFERIFHRGDLPVEDLLELTEPHFRFRPTPAPELSFEDWTGRELVRMAEAIQMGIYPTLDLSGKALCRKIREEVDRCMTGSLPMASSQESPNEQT